MLTLTGLFKVIQNSNKCHRLISFSPTALNIFSRNAYFSRYLKRPGLLYTLYIFIEPYIIIVTNIITINMVNYHVIIVARTFLFSTV